jgi:hypothetical protein
MIKPEEAREIFDKWLSENTLLLCTTGLHSCWSLFLRGRVAVLSEGIVEVRSTEGAAGVRIRLSDIEAFEYAEPKHASPEIRAAFPEDFGDAGTLVLALPLRVPDLTMPRDKLFFMEIPEKFDK